MPTPASLWQAAGAEGTQAHRKSVALPGGTSAPPKDTMLPSSRLQDLKRLNGCRRRRRGYSSGFCRMTTLVPTGTRSYRSATSVLTSRKQPDETAVPIVSGRLVP